MFTLPFIKTDQEQECCIKYRVLDTGGRQGVQTWVCILNQLKMIVTFFSVLFFWLYTLPEKSAGINIISKRYNLFFIIIDRLSL
jgi:hypothetical protein